MSGYLVPGYHVSDHSAPVPLDWSDPDSPTIELFFREITAPGREGDDLPLLLYLQGGPGGQGIRPLPGEDWLPEAVAHYRVVMPDQRGTGRSAPIDGAVIAGVGQGQGQGEAAAAFLSHFLADSIINDFEHLRRRHYGGRRWFTLGQSYGGFLTLVYLSHFPEALLGCLVAGGIPGLPPAAEEVYRRTYPRAKAKTEQFYARYPPDEPLVGQIADLLTATAVHLPDGDRLTVPRLQSLGLDLGTKAGAHRLHWLLDTALIKPDRLSQAFLYEVNQRTAFAANPLFWTLQEFIYGCGDNGPINWAAHRELARHPEFAATARPLLFTGEMALPWMFDQVRCLRPFKSAVERLMRRESWPELYRPAVLAANEVPLQAVVYFDDLYVDADLQLGALAGVGNSHAWVTNEYEHDGIHSSGVFTRLRELLAERGGGLT
ncbi:MAG: alpha/beta hydrolase [Bifidobacteriaceae bacterium]|jgi:pimeloyl-ACP methyl ester carboxylesterase|nr:alpha/beta hydrolase [Bifidobacteriaceae bacterium]